MRLPRAPWWMYTVAAIFALTFGFNLWQEFFGLADAGFTMGSSAGPYAAKLVAGSIVPGGPFHKSWGTRGRCHRAEAWARRRGGPGGARGGAGTSAFSP
jgi:hypothetical protein